MTPRDACTSTAEQVSNPIDVMIVVMRRYVMSRVAAIAHPDHDEHLDRGDQHRRLLHDGVGEDRRDVQPQQR